MCLGIAIAKEYVYDWMLSLLQYSKVIHNCMGTTCDSTRDKTSATESDRYEEKAASRLFTHKQTRIT